MLRRIHPHTQEFCLRVMSAAEDMRGLFEHRRRLLPFREQQILLREDRRPRHCREGRPSAHSRKEIPRGKS